MVNDELLNLKNLGKTSTRRLYVVDIHSAIDLCWPGSVGTCRTVRARGFRASKVLLYAIEGALLDVHWNELSSDHKAAPLGELETFPVRSKS